MFINNYICKDELEEQVDKIQLGEQIDSNENRTVHVLNQLPGINESLICYSINDFSQSDYKKFESTLYLQVFDLCHPNIQSIDYIKNYQDKLLIIAKKIEGTCLKQILSDEYSTNAENTPKMSPTFKSKILYGVAQALLYAHHNKMHHTNLSPSSIVIDSEKNPIIIEMFSLFYSKKFLDDPYYKCNEIIASKQQSNINRCIKNDIYSFGMLWYNMYENLDSIDLNNGVKGQDSIQVKLDALKHGSRPIKTNSIPENVYKLMLQCWAPEPLNDFGFEIICKNIVENPFPGTNTEEYMDYVNKCNESIKKTRPNEESSDTDEDYGDFFK